MNVGNWLSVMALGATPMNLDSPAYDDKFSSYTTASKPSELDSARMFCMILVTGSGEGVIQWFSTWENVTGSVTNPLMPLLYKRSEALDVLPVGPERDVEGGVRSPGIRT